jgi:nitrogen regulatory protein PII
MGSGRVRIAEEFNTNVLIITVVNDEMEQKVIDTIRKKSSNADGKIFVSELKDAIDIPIRPTRRIYCIKNIFKKN